MLRNLITTKFLRVGLCLIGLTAFPAFTVTSAEDDLESLKKQVEELKKENAALREENLELRRELREVKSKSESSKPAGEGGEIVGKIWEITAIGQGGKRFGPFRFLAHDGNIYIGDLTKPRIGFYTEKGPNVRIDVSDSPNPIANGVYSLIQFSKTPPTYKGRFTNPNGQTIATVELRILQD